MDEEPERVERDEGPLLTQRLLDWMYQGEYLARQFMEREGSEEEQEGYAVAAFLACLPYMVLQRRDECLDPIIDFLCGELGLEGFRRRPHGPNMH